MRPRSTSGQAAVEYIAVVALVAIVFAIAGAFTLNGRAIAAATMGQLKRGLCIVEGHDCKEVHPPCTVSSSGSSDDWHVDIAIVRIGGGKAALVEHQSDGRILVTLTDHADLGVSTGFGLNLKLGDKLAFGGEVRAAALASLSHGTTYRVPDDRTADELIQTMRKNRLDPSFWNELERIAPSVSQPVSRYRQLDLSGSANLKVLTGKVGGGVREDLATGKKTIYLKGAVSLDGEGEGVGAVGGSAEGQLALVLDRHNKPIDLIVLGAGKFNASADLPALLEPVAGHVRPGIERTWELEGHLDLTQPGRLDAVLGSLSHPSRLVDMVHDEGTFDFNSYGAHELGVDVGSHVKAGLSFGGEVSHMSSSRKLLSAMEHTPEGFWVPRYDCLAAASRV